ncbi:MAG: PaaI family thioesterase [bacterium]
MQQISPKIEGLFQQAAANKLLGLTLISCSADLVEIAMPLKPAYLQEVGVVHGGLISALADTTAVYLLYPYLDSNQAMTSIEFKINFLHPAVLEKGDLHARAKTVKKGRKIAVCDVEVLQAEKLIAKGLFTYLIFDRT